MKNLRPQQQLAFLQNILQSLPYPFYVIDADNYSIVMANAAADHGRIIVGNLCHEISHGHSYPCTGAEHPCPLVAVKATGETAVCEHIHLDQHNRPRYYEIHGHPVLNASGRVIQMIEFAIDITARKVLEKKMQELATTDALTGIINRRGFMDMAKKQLAIAARAGKSLLLLYVDLDSLKWINDHLGHSTGDQALVETAALLKQTFRESDIIARLGGDEFAVLLTDPCAADGGPALQRLATEQAKWNESSSHPFRLSLSSGVAWHEAGDSGSLEDLLLVADARMYDNKRQKKYALVQDGWRDEKTGLQGP